MRLSWLALVGYLAIDAMALGLSHHSRSIEPTKRSVFAGIDPPDVWAATKFEQLRTASSSSASNPSLQTREEKLPALLRLATEPELRRAREVVEQAVEEAAVRNRKRLENPLRNSYKLKDATKVFRREEVPTLLHVTDEIAEAAALVAEAEVFGDDFDMTNDTEPSVNSHEPRKSDGFWMEDMKHQGSWPWGDNKDTFKVFRNVKDYGAKGDGKTDDTKAIRKAIQASGMCGDGCYSSTTHGAIIYFPSGKYLVSSTIEKHYGTQLIGNPNDRPVMMASKFFVGLGIFSTNKYYGDDQEDEAKQEHAWYINTAIFWGQIRNFVIDISGAYPKVMMSGLHYQVAQATSLQYVDFKASEDDGAEQRAIFAENGSGGHMSDLTFKGGKFGIYGGNQQFTGQRITFTNVRTAVQLIWDWGWSWKSIVVDGSSTAFKLISEDGSHGIGGALIVDSVIKNTKTAVAMFSPTKKLGKGTTGLTLDNVKLENVQVLVDEMSDEENSSSTTEIDGGKKSIDLWVLGRSYQNNTLGKKLIQETTSPRVTGLLDPKNPLGLKKDPFFERAKPQYESASAEDFVSTKSSGCKGDGKSDDRACLQDVFTDAAKSNKIVFIDAGTYILRDTLHVPPGSRIVGENWAQLAATGSKFDQEKQPRAVIQVGDAGDKGTVEMQDLIITSKGETSGAVFIEWNIEAEGPGRAAMWEVHIRVGGTDGSGLTSTSCPPVQSGVTPGCKGGSLMMHLTESGSVYVENGWYWVADHDLDDPTWEDNNNKMTQTSIYVARGFLAESTKPSWLYGTSSEHSVYYQYEFFKSANVLAGMIQTEQPYYQPTPPPPAPFDASLNVFHGDPVFKCTKKEPCDSGWALRMVDSRDITILGAGLYSWFSTYTQDCLATSSCQESMVQLSGNKGDIVIHNLVTIGAVNMIASDKELITAEDNRAVDFHPFWSQLSRFEAREFIIKPPVSADPIETGEGLDLSEAVKADLSSVCSRSDTCVDPTDKVAASCGSGYTQVGYDYSDCWFGQAKMICCKTSVAPTSCIWRANVGSLDTDCDARCDEGEVPLYTSAVGGGNSWDDNVNCVRGKKAFCCKHHGFSALTAGCEWESQLTCIDSRACSEGKQYIATRKTGNGGLGCAEPRENYCCPRKQLDNCHWVGKGDCADVSCNNKEITVAIGSYGDSSSACNWERKKSLCCTANLKAPEATCGIPICKRKPWECPPDPYALDDDSEELKARALAVAERDDEDEDEDEDEDGQAGILTTNPNDPGGLKGASRRDFEVLFLVGAAQLVRRIFLYARTYNGPSPSYGRNTGARPGTNSEGIRQGGIARDGCTAIETYDIMTELTGTGPQPNPDTRYDGNQMDHRVDLQYMRDLVYAVINGELASGTDITNIVDPIEYSTFEPYWNWNNQLLPIGMRQITPTSPDGPGNPAKKKENRMRNVNNRLFEILGGNTNRGTLILLESHMNRIKGAIFGGVFNDKTGRRTGNVAPRADDEMRNYLRSLISPLGTMATETDFFQNLESVIAVWRYIRHDNVYPGIQNIRRALRNEITLIENETRQMSTLRPSLAGFTAIFDEFDWDWWERAAEHSRGFILTWRDEATRALREFHQVHGESHEEQLWIEQRLDALWEAALRWILRPDDLS